MNGNFVMAIITANTLLLSAPVSATDVPSRKSDTSGAATVEESSAPPGAKTAEARKCAEALKWDQLDPKALEAAAKKAQRKSPFTTVPAER